MARITLRQLLDHAAEHGDAMPAFNVNNMEQVKAIMAAADAVDAPVILQVSRGARSYAGDAMLTRSSRRRGHVAAHPVCVHQDHGNDAAARQPAWAPRCRSPRWPAATPPERSTPRSATRSDRT